MSHSSVFLLQLGADRWSPERRFVQNYSVDNEGLTTYFHVVIFFSYFLTKKDLAMGT